MAWKTGRVHPGDRPALAYLEHGAPDGVPVMLIHSFASTGREFEPLFPALPPSIHAYAFTFHGHGEASEEGMGYTVPDLSDEIAAFMDAVGVESAVLVGASSGGYIAQWFAGEHPSRVRGLVTVGSPRSFRDKPAFARMQEAMLALSDPVAPDFARQFAGEASFPHLPEGYIEEMLAESCRIPASVWRATYLGLGESDVPSTTFRISVPALRFGAIRITS
jgi:rifampin ADP-ribosylating transferase